VFSFDSPQEYSSDFVMATLAATSTTSDITTDQCITRPSAAPTMSTSRAKISSNNEPFSINKQVSTDHSSTTPIPAVAAVSIAETPNKDGNSWLQERTVANNSTDHHNGEPVTINRPVEDSKKEFATHSHDKETDNLLDSLFDDIINDDEIDNIYGFTHQHQHTSTGSNFVSRGRQVIFYPVGIHSKDSSSTDSNKQQLTFSQPESPHSPVTMDTGDVTSGCVMLPPTPPTKKVSLHYHEPRYVHNR